MAAQATSPPAAAAEPDNIPNLPGLETNENVLDLDDAALDYLKDATEDNLVRLRDELEKANPGKSPDGDVVPPILALHPIFDKEGVARRYEILARGKANNFFPFMWFAKLNRSQRILFTMRCARLSQFLWDRDIDAHFNLQHEDYAAISDRIDIDSTRWELAEFGMTEPPLETIWDGNIPGARLFGRVDVETYGQKWKNVTLDDCLTVSKKKPLPGINWESRGGDEVIELVRNNRREGGEKIFDTIKIDFSIANRAFRPETVKTFGNPVQQKPEETLAEFEARKEAEKLQAEEENEPYRLELERVVRELLKLDPEMLFVVEFSVRNDEWCRCGPLEEYRNASEYGVMIQGGALGPYAIRIPDRAVEAQLPIIQGETLAREVGFGEGFIAGKAAAEKAEKAIEQVTPK